MVTLYLSKKSRKYYILEYFYDIRVTNYSLRMFRQTSAVIKKYYENYESIPHKELIFREDGIYKVYDVFFSLWLKLFN